MPHIIVLVGLPACGKSTFIQNGDFQNHEIISSDNLIEAYAKTVNKTYEEVFSEYIKIASRKIHELYDEALKSNKNIIIDRTNLTEKSRNIFLSKAPNHYKKFAVVFDIDETLRHSRHEERKEKTGKCIPDHVIDNMRQTYQEPSIAEGFHEIIKIKG